MHLPDFIIIGAGKCGTTSLHYYLGLHPQISMSKEKELNFFIREGNWGMGIEWYQSNFTGEHTLHGESSPSYTSYPFYEGVPERMYATVPDAKLIYILRDPIDRIVSHYIQDYAIGKESRTLEQTLKTLENNLYVSTSQYHMQLSQYLKYFSSANILIIVLEELYHQRRQILQKIFRFLNVDDTFYTPKFLHIKHRSGEKGRKNRIGLLLKKLSEMKFAKLFPTITRMSLGKVLYLPFSNKIERPVLSEDLKGNLIEYLKDDVHRLREYMRYDFKKWCV